MRQFFCILCQGLIYKSETIFCKNCLSNLTKIKVKKRKFKEPIDHYYLLPWTKENDFLCRTLIYSLKKKPMSHFLTLASLFHSLKIFETKPILACPISSKSGPDHARSFSLALEKLFGCLGVLPIRVQKDGRPQKYKKTRNERFSIVNNQVKDVGNWIFIDDVFVTGATCYKVSENIGTRPRVVLTLLYREKEQQ